VQPENLAYALVQLLHNFGAVAVVGGAGFALWAPAGPLAREARIAGLVALGWAVQIASGAGFGAVSYTYHAQLPEIHNVAFAALATKVACAAVGVALAFLLQVRAARWSGPARTRCWRALLALAATALAAAAFLRWFS
jgi:hypothetical protein